MAFHLLCCNVLRAAVAVIGIAAANAAMAADGKLLLTGGVSSVDGAAGGGLTPWAVTASHAASDEVGATAHLTRVQSQDYTLTAYGAAVGWHDRLEFSLARQDLDTGRTGVALGLPGLHLKLDILGAKWRVAGDAVLDSDRWMPQVALGVQVKRLDAAGLAPTLASLGAKTEDVDLTVSATKLFLAQGLLVNGTLRLTRANQNGLLGFGSATQRHHQPMAEFSLAWLASRHWAIGAEWRMKPDNLNPSALGAGLKEGDWSDLFVVWAPNKQVSFTLAHVALGPIVPAAVPRHQRATYLSTQVAF
jgi:Protein of unknown function (DUF3034)